MVTAHYIANEQIKTDFTNTDYRDCCYTIYNKATVIVHVCSSILLAVEQHGMTDVNTNGLSVVKADQVETDHASYVIYHYLLNEVIVYGST